MLQVTLLDADKSIFMNATPYLTSAPQFSTGEHGMERCDLTLGMSFKEAAHYFSLAGSPNLHIAGKGPYFRGRVEDITIDNNGIVLVAYGLWSILDDEQTYTALWSTTSFDDWEELTEENLSDVMADGYKTDSRDRLYIAPTKGKAFVSGALGGLYFMVPDGGLRNASVVMFAYEWVAGANWTFRVRSFTSTFSSANTFFADTPSSYATKTGAKFYTYTAAATLSIEMYSNYFSAKTLGTAINAVSTTLAPSSLRVDTTSGTTFLAGTRTVTPASMTNIVNGIKLLFGSNAVTLEKVTVSNVTGTTFDATFKNGHSSGEAIKSIDDWAVPEVDTTVTAGFAAGAGVVVTPATMANIVAGMGLIVGFGGEAEETISVTSVTATTFTATFLYAHPTSDKIKNGLNTYTVRPDSMTGIITGMNLDIGGRNAETVYVTGVTATTFTAAFRYGHPGNAGVSTSKTQLVTPSSITGILKGHYLQIGNNGGVTDSAEEIVEVLSVTGSSFIANFNTPHASTDTVKRVFRADADVYLKITDLRVATSTVNMIDTTIAISITAGSRTVTPADMTGIYVGQKLYIAASGNNGEIVTVTAITSTTFTAVFALSHTASVLVKGIAIYADEIVGELIDEVSTDNAQLSSSTALVESPGLDLTDILYEDQSAMDVLIDLVGRGDTETPPRTWAVGVWDDVLHFWPRGTDSKTWYLDASTLKLSRSLQSVVTEVVAAYKDPNGRLMRTSAAASDATSEAWAMKRKVVIDVNSTYSGYAEIARDTLLEAKSGFIPAAEITFSEIYTATGALANPQDVRGDDNLVIRNMPAPLPSVDFRIRRTEFGEGGLRLELEGIPDSIETLLSTAGRPPAVNGARRPFVLGPVRRLSTK